MPGPAYRIHTSRLVIRCYEPADAPLLLDAITASLEHLRPWMPWAHHEPEPLDDKVQRLRRFRANFDSDSDYIYGIFTPAGDELIGGTGLHTRAGEGAREIGYWISARHVNRGYATESSAALTRVGFEVDGVDRMEIRCDPANAASAAIPRKLGYTHDGTLRRTVRQADGTLHDAMVWTLLRDEYPGSPAASAVVEAFDALGRRLL